MRWLYIILYNMEGYPSMHRAGVRVHKYIETILAPKWRPHVLWKMFGGVHVWTFFCESADFLLTPRTHQWRGNGSSRRSKRHSTELMLKKENIDILQLLLRWLKVFWGSCSASVMLQLRVRHRHVGHRPSQPHLQTDHLSCRSEVSGASSWCSISIRAFHTLAAWL